MFHRLNSCLNSFIFTEWYRIHRLSFDDKQTPGVTPNLENWPVNQLKLNSPREIAIK